ncbi:hypothetical protein LOD99_2835 [Oopsacas minuta]|uniref:CUE domain-containing protein n=1 Tax=Oopsacas minuta TaxID=111878 RepID=A0AAV7K1C5_9METZ|nr:hypothetical protein LOD99_2835 [Oopsacas minuta]
MSYTNANEIPFLSTNITPVISSHKPELLSEKIDWGDSSDSDKCSPQILSPEGQQPDTNILTEDKSSIQWGSWTGWGSNFMTHKDKIVAKNSTNGSVKKSNFDPTIQPPRKHSTSSLKSSNEIPEFTPSFSRYKSLDSDNPENVLSLSGTKLSSSLGDSSRIMLPAGAEWEWSKSSTPILSRKNGNSETSSPRSDTDDPRNSKLNPFAVPWKPFAPSKPVQMKLDDQDKLSHLRGFFPTLPLTELKVFLKEHDNNIDRAVEAIIDQAEALNLDIPMSSQVAMPKKMRSPKISEKVTTPLDATAPEFKTVLLDDTSDKKWQQNSFESTKVPTVPPATTTTTWIDTSSLVKSFDTPSQSESNFHDVTNSESIPYVLQLDPVLAKQLIKQFGPIPGYTKEGSLDQSLSQIVLSEDTAQLIHQLWCKSAQSVDPYYVPPGQGSAWVPPDDPTQQAKHQLYSLFPGIDTHDLDQVLTAKNFSLSAANEFINTALSAPLIPKDPLTPSFALVTQRGPKSFPPLPTKTPISSNQTTKPLF